MKKLFIIFGFVFLTFGLLQTELFAQRKAVSGAEVTGTFEYKFKGKFKGSRNVIAVQALGKGKLKVQFDLTYPYTMANGELMVNVGTSTGTALIEGDTAVYTDDENGTCRITLKFTKPGTLVVTQKGDSVECGFGFNVSADGTYQKSSSKKPKFESIN